MLNYLEALRLNDLHFKIKSSGLSYVSMLSIRNEIFNRLNGSKRIDQPH